MDASAPHIVVSGSIGTGKTPLIKRLALELGVEAYFEPSQDNPYLEDFYDDKATYALRSQLYFFAAGLRQHRKIAARAAQGAGAIQERSVYEHHQVIAQALLDEGHLNPVDFQQLADLFWGVEDLLPAPRLLVYLDAPVDVLAARTRRSGVDRDYLQRLGDRYQAFLDNWLYSPVLRLDTTQIDLSTPEGLDEAAQLITARLDALNG